MRDLLSKVMTGSMVAGAALFVAACGGGEEAEVNNTANLAIEDPLMNDVTAIDAMNGTDANLGAGVDANTTIDANTVTIDANTVTTDTTANTTGM